VLNEDNDPSRDDSWFAGETAAAMRDFARTVTEAPPLRLAAGFSPARTRRRLRGARRWRTWTWTWLAPVTAAAMVVALAVALVISRNLTNGGVVPTIGSTLTNPATAGPGGVPRYYVAIQDETTGGPGKPAVTTTPLVVGDSLTGEKLATIPPPAGVVFLDVAAAGDDRTFVAAGRHGSGASATMELFEVHLDPGASHPVVMTSMPMKPQPMWWGNGADPALIADTFPVALSSSGTELAVAETVGTRGTAVKVFSVATGALLHEWTTTDLPRLPASLPDAPALTWIDDDRALALATLAPLGTPVPSGPVNVARQTVRRLDVDGPAGSDLIADGTFQWEVPANGAASTCGYYLNWPPVISADGKTFTCVTGYSSFVTYPLTAGAKGAGQGRVDLSVGKGKIVNTVLWTSTSGDTLIAEWAVAGGVPVQSDGKGTEIGVISHGKSTPLRFPPGFQQVYAGDMAW
jgi:hypothetical protein